MRCLLVEDYLPLRKNINERLVEEGFVVDVSATGDVGLWFAENHAYDCIVLDIMLPEVNGLDLLHKIRKSQNKTPVIMISARDSVEQRIEGLNMGADDYLVKPFALGELVARIRALIRRSYRQESPTLNIGDLMIDCLTKKVTRAGQDVFLTPREYRLLEYLAFRAGEPVSRTDIWEHVYEDQTGGNSNAVDVYISYLRKKLNSGGGPDLIRTRRGQGYIIERPLP
ncbi:response regulator transcription factor [Luteolibacter yonseiensis]|uniref:Response regulator transcription factor n=1 Tax=Luteolibacter yonseiensis TaxID=1144680 RepID=A0A934R244_9BACT|nr:response regulator transcription factor [Luteolibacter yonseiensis]MBK1816993.1 response regulator transcription factor [Luteolibacter yonseiensis]